MLYQQSPDIIAQTLLEQPKKILETLTQNDTNMLTWNKNQLFRKWPRCMVPGPQKIEGNNILFTNMLENTREKAYLYGVAVEPRDYFQGKRRVEEEEEMREGREGGGEENGEFMVAVEVGQNQQAPTENLQKIQEMLIQKSVKTEQIRQRQQFSPFLANHDNPFDRNANTKSLRQKFDKIKLDERKRNIAALVGQSKKTEPREPFNYGRSAPKKPTQTIDITDILKYTLGIKKEKEQGIKVEPIHNPFVRVPQKYTDTTGDYYKRFTK